MFDKCTIPISKDTKGELDDFKQDYSNDSSYNDLILLMIKDILECQLNHKEK